MIPIRDQHRLYMIFWETQLNNNKNLVKKKYPTIGLCNLYSAVLSVRKWYCSDILYQTIIVRRYLWANFKLMYRHFFMFFSQYFRTALFQDPESKTNSHALPPTLCSQVNFDFLLAFPNFVE